MGPGDITQLIKCLPHTYEDLRSVTDTHIKSWARRHALVNPSTGEAGTGDPWGLLAHQPVALSDLQINVRSCLHKVASASEMALDVDFCLPRAGSPL